MPSSYHLSSLSFFSFSKLQSSLDLTSHFRDVEFLSLFICKWEGDFTQSENVFGRVPFLSCVFAQVSILHIFFAWWDLDEEARQGYAYDCNIKFWWYGGKPHLRATHGKNICVHSFLAGKQLWRMLSTWFLYITLRNSMYSSIDTTRHHLSSC